MLTNIVGGITILGGAIFGILSVYAIIDEMLYNVTKPFVVFSLLILSICCIFSGYKLFSM